MASLYVTFIDSPAADLDVILCFPQASGIKITKKYSAYNAKRYPYAEWNRINTM